MVVEFIKDKLPYTKGAHVVFDDKEAQALIDAGYAIEYIPDVKVAIAKNNRMVHYSKIEK